jgi:hypothetical protein
MKSVMQHQFSMIPRVEIPRSVFNRSHGYKTTFNAGLLIPFYIDEALPGDTFSCNATLFARLATPIVPIMDNLFLETFFFAVPIRLIWDNWQKFNGERINPSDSTDYLVPQIVSPAAGWSIGGLSDYFGLPIGKAGLSTSALWHRAYNLIWNEWFRDENLQQPAYINTGDGPDDNTKYPLLYRGKRHDYFTSALPWPQKGTGVNLPLGTSAPVYGNGKSLSFTSNEVNHFGLVADSNGVFKPIGAAYDQVVGCYPSLTEGLNTNQNVGVVTHGESGLFADLSLATAATINSLRQAFQIQRLLERDARGGSRYTEIIRSHFGVISPDARLQRPEYLGGNSTRIIINPVQQTAATAIGLTPQGNLAAFGLAADSGHGFTQSFTEHCVLLGLVNVRADLTYQQGLPRMFSRKTRYDFYWPALAHLGEQSILNKEIYCQGTADDDLVFGYQERWSEYRHFPSQITGQFRSSAPTPLDFWHLSQKFTSLPTLNNTFITDIPPINRVVAVTNQPHFLLDTYIDLKCARPMPVYSVPGLIDHF